MGIHLIIGRQGSGKTLFLVKQAYAGYKKGKTIYSNIKLNFPFKLINLKEIAECSLINGLVIMDEGHLILPARNSMSKISRIVTDGFLSMHRKQNLEIYISTQTERKIDVRVRDETDFLYVCTKYAIYENDIKLVTHNQNLPDDVKIYVRLQILETISQTSLDDGFIGNKYFDKFNTKEIVKVIPLDDEKKSKKK
jgi:hypothetical protein